MSNISWIVLGLFAGLLGSRLVNNNNQGIVADIIVGIFGAYIGGYLFRFFGQSGVTGFNLWSLLVATVGAALCLSVLYLFQRRI